MPLWSLLLVLLMGQSPGDGWAIQSSPAREVKRLYWELFQTTEVWVRIDPVSPEGPSHLVSLVFQAFFPGPAKRNPSSGLPEVPSGPPARLLLKAEPLPLTAIRELSLRFTIDGRTLDLTPPGGRYRNLPCLVAINDCTPYAVEVDADPALLRSLTAARSVEGEALGIKIKLAAADLAALANFSAQIGLSPKNPGK